MSSQNLRQVRGKATLRRRTLANKSHIEYQDLAGGDNSLRNLKQIIGLVQPEYLTLSAPSWRILEVPADGMPIVSHGLAG